MRMKESNWPVEQIRRPPRVVQALKAATREFFRDIEKQKQAKKVRDLPDPFKEKA